MRKRVMMAHSDKPMICGAFEKLRKIKVKAEKERN
jgi:hypothetical protein